MKRQTAQRERCQYRDERRGCLNTVWKPGERLCFFHETQATLAEWDKNRVIIALPRGETPFRRRVGNNNQIKTV
jgi:hypothetical protein